MVKYLSLKCSKYGKEVMDEWEYHDNNGVCDDCYIFFAVFLLIND